MRLTPQPHGVKRPGDPYEFGEDEGNNLNTCKIDGFTRTPPIKDEPKDNLFTDEGLQVTYDQLENIFDNSDYTSSDEAVSDYRSLVSLIRNGKSLMNFLHRIIVARHFDTVSFL